MTKILLREVGTPFVQEGGHTRLRSLREWLRGWKMEFHELRWIVSEAPWPWRFMRNDDSPARFMKDLQVHASGEQAQPCRYGLRGPWQLYGLIRRRNLTHQADNRSSLTKGEVGLSGSRVNKQTTIVV
jgi:hypothetical protein